MDFWFSFLKWFCPPSLIESIEGDVRQKFEEDVASVGMRRAGRRLAWNVIRFFRPAIILRNKFSIKLTQTMMLQNYFNVAWRSMKKQKLYTGINVFGLSIGFTFSILVILFIQEDWSYDRFHSNRDHIFKLNTVTCKDGVPNPETRSHIIAHPVGWALKDAVPAVTHASRFTHSKYKLILGDQQRVVEMQRVDEDFTTMFSFDMIAGSARLDAPHKLLISDSLARRYFGEESALGKVVQLDTSSYTISGIFRDFPEQSSITLNMVSLFRTKGRSEWFAADSYTFIQVKENSDMKAVQEAIDRFAAKSPLNEFEKGKTNVHIELLSLGDLHYDPLAQFEKASNRRYAYILIAIVVVVLLVASVNYVLMAIAGFMSRAREIGVRKVIGGTQKQIRFQFLGDSALVVLIALPVSLFAAYTLIPQFNEFTSKQLSLSSLFHTETMAVFAGVVFLTAFFAGGYPAVILARVSPEKILKSNAGKKYKSTLGRYLIVFQFVICITFLTGATVMMRQMQFISKRDIGFDASNIINIKTANDQLMGMEEIADGFRSELMDDPDILGMASIMEIQFGSFPSGLSFQDSLGNSIHINGTQIGYGFFELLHIPLLEGRVFSPDHADRDNFRTIVINQSLHKFSQSNVRVREFLSRQNVIGVVADFNFESLEHEIGPAIFTCTDGTPSFGSLFVKIDETDRASSLEKLGKTWKTVMGEAPFQYSYVEDDIAGMYRRHYNWMKIINVSAILGMIMAGMGVIGMTGLTLRNRVREIGIRRIFGARILEILTMLSREYLLLLAVAAVPALLLANYLAGQWLDSFAYRTELSWLMFAVPVGIMTLLLLLVVCGSALRTVAANPVDSIRHE
jgi:putative ABC transport system permease protein